MLGRNKRPDPKPGDRYGRLTILAQCEPPPHIFRAKTRAEKWYTARCECGVTKPILGNSLKQGSTVSCGCKLREQRDRFSAAHSVALKRVGKNFSVSRLRESAAEV